LELFSARLSINVCKYIYIFIYIFIYLFIYIYLYIDN
jgi:hypothetical protein